MLSRGIDSKIAIFINNIRSIYIHLFSMAREITELTQKIQEQQNLIRRLQRYLPERIVHRILTTPDQLKIEGERRNVTVLFADITGFTELSETLDAEDVVQVINGYFTRMLEIIAKYEGTLDKFMGDAMMVLFGAPVAHENDPERAIRAALEMQSALSAFNRSRIAKRFLPKPLQMSIAINSGRVFAGNVGSETRAEYTIMGENVNLAYRIESIAEPGQVVISENTFHKVRNVFRFQSLGEFKFKGIRNPTQVYLVIGGKEQIANSTMSKRAEPTAIPLVGRTKELAILEAQLQLVERGQGSIIYITGDAGVGKSRLIVELERLILSRGILFMKSDCVSFSQSLAYYPFLSILKTFFSIWEEDSSETRAKKITIELQKLDLDPVSIIPILGPLFGIKPKAEEKMKSLGNLRKKLFALIQDILIRATKLYNVRVLIIEDLHWSDQTSLELLTELSSKIASEPILLCVTARPDFQPAWVKSIPITTITLDRFTAEDTNQFIGYLFNTEKIAIDLAKLIQQKSEGNPLFVEELTRNLTESHLTQISKDQVTLAEGVSSLAIPDTIDQVVMARLDRLDEPVRLVAQYASVIGKQFSVSILQELIDLAPSILTKYLDQLQTAGIIQPTNRQFTFYHGMLAEVAYQSLLLHHRQSLHGKVGTAFERLYRNRLPEHYETLAYHYYLSDLPQKAITYLGLAADKTQKFYANAEAIDYYQKQIKLIDRLPQQKQKKEYFISLNQALKCQGEIWRLIGEPNKALSNYTRLLTLARRNKDIAAESEALKNLGLVYFDRGEYRRALKYYQASLRLRMKLNDTTGQAATLNNIGVIYLNLGRYQEAISCYYTCLKVAEQSQDKKWQAHALNNLALTYRERGEYQKALEFGQQALQLREALGDKKMLAATVNNLGLIYENLCQYPLAKKSYQRVLKISKQIGYREGEHSAQINLGEICQILGQDTLAEQYYQNALTLAKEMNDPTGESVCEENLGRLYLRNHNLDPALEHLQKAVNLAKGIKSRERMVQTQAPLAIIYALLNRYPAAMKLARQTLLLTHRLQSDIYTTEINYSFGRIYFIHRNYPQAIKYFTLAKTTSEKTNNQRQRGWIFAALGQAYFRSGRISQGSSFTKIAKNIAMQIGDKPLLQEIKRGLQKKSK